MIFEGSEKKFEIVVENVDLRSLPLSFWQEMVAASQAEIYLRFQ